MNSRFYLLFAGLFIAGMLATAFIISYSSPITGMLSGTLQKATLQKALYNETPTKTVYRVYFENFGTKIAGLLSIPKKEDKLPAFFVIPAAGIDKSTEQNHLGNALNDLGFVTLVIDVRGVGESNGSINNLQQDVTDYVNGYTPTQYMAVFDARLCYEFLKTLPEVDQNRIYAAGESMGGRFAAVAAGNENGIAGLLLISTAGYNFPPQENMKVVEFLDSINPSTYIGSISPRPVVIVHAKDDKTIAYDMGVALFEKAQEPKKLFTLEKGGHSFESFQTAGTADFLKEATDFLLSNAAA